MSLGGIGVISVASNLLPAEMHKLCAEYLSGDKAKATEMQIKYTGLMNELFSDVNPVPVKTAMGLMGLPSGPLRQPLVPMKEENLEVLKKALKDSELI